MLSFQGGIRERVIKRLVFQKQINLAISKGENIYLHLDIPLHNYYVHVWYYIAFIFVGQIAIFAYKGIILPYPSGNLTLEVILLLFTSGVEAVRNFMGQKGNLTEQADSILISLALTLPVVFGILYFLFWQTYVLRIEVITNAIQLTLLALETLFALLTVASLAKYGNFTIRR